MESCLKNERVSFSFCLFFSSSSGFFIFGRTNSVLCKAVCGDGGRSALVSLVAKVFLPEIQSWFAAFTFLKLERLSKEKAMRKEWRTD